MYINSIMPTFVSRYHHIYINQFLKTGKSRFIKTSNQIYAKQKSGCLVPIIVYLIIDSMTKNHLILMFEPDMKLKLFDEPNTDAPFTFLLTDHKFNVGEVAHNFEAITSISP